MLLRLFGKIKLEGNLMKIIQKQHLNVVFAIISLMAMTSCTINRRTDSIVAGFFSGNNSYNETITCYLKVNKISKDVFDSRDGLNVIKDEVKGGYYELTFSYIDEQKEQYNYNFKNLKDAYDGAAGTPISYKDDNNCWFSPHTSMNSKDLEMKDCYYSVHLKNSNLEIYAYLYYSEE